MNRSEKYSKYALVNEMMETPGIVRDFRTCDLSPVAELIKVKSRLMLTGEGSSRIFPAKNAIRLAMTRGASIDILTEPLMLKGSWVQYSSPLCMLPLYSLSGITLIN